MIAYPLQVTNYMQKLRHLVAILLRQLARAQLYKVCAEHILISIYFILVFNDKLGRFRVVLVNHGQ